MLNKCKRETVDKSGPRFVTMDRCPIHETTENIVFQGSFKSCLVSYLSIFIYVFSIPKEVHREGIFLKAQLEDLVAYNHQPYLAAYHLN